MPQAFDGKAPSGHLSSPHVLVASLSLSLSLCFFFFFFFSPNRNPNPSRGRRRRLRRSEARLESPFAASAPHRRPRQPRVRNRSGVAGVELAVPILFSDPGGLRR